MDIKNQSNISYTGLSSRLGKRIFARRNIEFIDSRISPQSRGIVGNLPSQWVQNIPHSNREENIKNLYAELGYFVRDILPFEKFKDDLNTLLTDILRKYRAICEDVKVTILETDSGFFAQGYKILNEKDGSTFFLKRFFKTTRSQEYKTPRHGVKAESNAYIYLRHNLKTKKEKKFFPRFYFGDIHNNYYIEEFIPEEKTIRYSAIPFLQRHELVRQIQQILKSKNLNHSDLTHYNVFFYYDKNNQLKAICYDLGGIEPLSKDFIRQ